MKLYKTKLYKKNLIQTFIKTENDRNRTQNKYYEQIIQSYWLAKNSRGYILWPS